MAPDELYRDQKSLLEPSIEFHVDPVTAFMLDKNQVKTKSGKVFCFIEARKGRATYAMSNYNQPPDPKAPSKVMHWFKLAFGGRPRNACGRNG